MSWARNVSHWPSFNALQYSNAVARATSSVRAVVRRAMVAEQYSNACAARVAAVSSTRSLAFFLCAASAASVSAFRSAMAVQGVSVRALRSDGAARGLFWEIC